MANETVMAPEIGLIKTDEFYLFYEMMMQSLKIDDVKEGINKSLYMLRKFLDSGNVVLYRKNKDGVYVYKMSDTPIQDMVQPVSCIINKTKPLIEDREIFNLDLNLSERLNNIVLLHISINNDNNDDCVVGILNTNKDKDLEPQFWERTKDTMQIIIKRAISYEWNTNAVNTDLLTGLDNRNSYEMRMRSFNNEDNNLVFGIFDLFRLKYVNDNYSHGKGDVYIKETAKILNKYWPKEKVKITDDGMEQVTNIGHCVYRVGGDEFVLLTNVEKLELSSIKGELARDESSMIDLEIGEKILLGLNYGIVRHTPGDTLKQTFMKADELLQEDKRQMYKKYNLDRRR